MDNEIESRISQVERRLARTQLLAGVLLVVAVIDYFPTLRKLFGDFIMMMLLMLGIVSLVIFFIFEIGQFSTKKK